MEASHFPYTGQLMNSTAAKLRQAAAGFVGNEKQLAVFLGRHWVSSWLISSHAPAPLLLPAVDIMYGHRETLMPLVATRKFGVGAASATSQ
jgi:hypothetical protein